MKTPFFHRISNKQFEAMKDEDLTWGDVMERFRQPLWCSYPDALGGKWGCWSLTLRKIRRQSDCGGCECVIKRLKDEV